MFTPNRLKSCYSKDIKNFIAFPLTTLFSIGVVSDNKDIPREGKHHFIGSRTSSWIPLDAHILTSPSFWRNATPGVLHAAPEPDSFLRADTETDLSLPVSSGSVPIKETMEKNHSHFLPSFSCVQWKSYKIHLRRYYQEGRILVPLFFRCRKRNKITIRTAAASSRFPVVRRKVFQLSIFGSQQYEGNFARRSFIPPSRRRDFFVVYPSRMHFSVEERTSVDNDLPSDWNFQHMNLNFWKI